MNDLLNLRIRMRHCYDASGVTFMPTPVGTDEVPLATFERELRRIVSEEVEKETATLTAEVASLRARVKELEAEAERDAMTRLAAWLRSGDRRKCGLTDDGGNFRLTEGHMVWRFVVAVACPKRQNPLDDERFTVVVGTDDRPATLAEVVHAALDEWARRFGEKGGGAMKLTMRCPFCGGSNMHWGEPVVLRGEERRDVFSCRGCGSGYDFEDIEEFAKQYVEALAIVSKNRSEKGEG